MTAIPWTADQVETMLHAALEAGDVKGVEAALLVMTRLDPVRAELLLDTIKVGLAIAAERSGADTGRTGP